MNAQKLNKPIVSCELCGEKVMRTKMKNHLRVCRNKDGGEKFGCQESDCAKAFKTKKYLAGHIQKVHSEPIKCPISGCGDLMKKSSLSNHMKRVHDRVKEECPNCSKSMSYGNLSRHLKLCTSDGSKSYKCENKGCRSAFKTPADRSSHISKKHNKPIECPFPDCSARVKKDYLSRHVRLVHDKIKEECPNCSKKVPYSHLKQHLKLCKKQGLRPYKCKEDGCNSMFRNTQDRSGHVRAVHSKAIKCPFPDCDVEIKKKNLPLHLRRIHYHLKEKCSSKNSSEFYGTLTKHGEVYMRNSDSSNLPGRTEKRSKPDQLEEECIGCGNTVAYGTLPRHIKYCYSIRSEIYEADSDESSFSEIDEDLHQISSGHNEWAKCPMPYCSFTFEKVHLPDHIRLVHDQLREECVKCGVKVQYGTLMRHLKVCRISDYSSSVEKENCAPQCF